MLSKAIMRAGEKKWWQPITTRAPAKWVMSPPFLRTKVRLPLPAVRPKMAIAGSIQERRQPVQSAPKTDKNGR
ncbi:hypothetical protein ORS3428_06125 [Mesorhizobium sp. ORS 3428]|nr:hypothetical protein ORS3428_06125 [Mesorhizobium sp. ORS 3428]